MHTHQEFNNFTAEQPFLKIQLTFIPRILLGITLFVYGYFAISFIKIEKPVPAESDDYAYCSGMEVFKEIQSIKARNMIAESVSKWFEADWYGFIYPAFYGTAEMLLNAGPKTIVYINLLSLLLILVFGWKWFGKSETGILILLGFLWFHPVCSFLFRYMPPLLNALQGLILMYLIQRISKATDERSRSRNIFTTVAVTLFFVLWRNYFAFYLAALIPLSRSKKELALFLTIFSGGFLFSGLSTQYLNAITFSTFSAIGSLNVPEIIHSISMQLDLGTKILHGLFLNIFNPEEHGTGLLYFAFNAAAPLMIFRAWRLGFRFESGLLLAVLVTQIVFFMLYPVSPQYFFRHFIHFLFPLVYVFFKLYSNFFPRITFFMVLLLPFLSYLQLGFPEKIMLYEERLSDRIRTSQLYQDFQKIPDLVEEGNKPELTILISHQIIRKAGKQKVIYSLPYISKQQKLIRYTSNPAKKFGGMHEQFGKISIDYLLYPPDFEVPQESVVFRSDYFLLCKNFEPVYIPL